MNLTDCHVVLLTMSSHIKILIALAAMMSAGAVCYAGGLPAAEQEAACLTELDLDYHECGSRCSRRCYYDGRNMQFRFGAGRSSELVADKFAVGSAASTDSDYFLEKFYGDYRGPVKSSGSYSMGFQYYLTRCISVGVDASAEILWYDVYDSVSDRKVGGAMGAAFTFMPQIRLSYYNRPMFRLYSAVSLGFVAYCGDYSDTRGSYAEMYGFFDGSLELASQVSLLGCEIGRTVFGFWEVGLGYFYTGARIGIGYRF